MPVLWVAGWVHISDFVYVGLRTSKREVSFSTWRFMGSYKWSYKSLNMG